MPAHIFFLPLSGYECPSEGSPDFMFSPLSVLDSRSAGFRPLFFGTTSKTSSWSHFYHSDHFILVTSPVFCYLL